jgi:hypothetical protein
VQTGHPGNAPNGTRQVFDVTEIVCDQLPASVLRPDGTPCGGLRADGLVLDVDQATESAVVASVVGSEWWGIGAPRSDWRPVLELDVDATPAAAVRRGPAGRAWIPVKCDAVSVSTSWGAPTDAGLLTRQAAGGAVLTLSDPGRAYDPSNPGSSAPTIGWGVRVELDDVPIWTGTVDAIAHDVGEATTELAGVDHVAELSAQELLVTSWPVERTDSRIRRILDAVGWPDESRDLDPGTVTMPAIVTGRGNAWALANDATDAELGWLYVTPDRVVHFRRRSARLGPRDPSLVIGCGAVGLGSLRVELAPELVATTVRAEPASGTPQEATDELSVEAHGFARTFTKSGLQVADAATALLWAEAMLASVAWPTPRYRLGTMRPSMTEAGPLLTATFGDTWLLRDLDHGPGLVRLVTLLGQAVSITPAGVAVTATTTRPAAGDELDGFVLDVDRLDVKPL